jgi:Uma2 family endonuclease
MAIAKEKEQEKETMTVSYTVELEIPNPPADLIFDDGIPMETNQHRINMNVLINSVVALMESRNRKDYFVGGNMFIYYNSEKVRNKDYRGPDFLVCLNVDGEKNRQGWVVWEEGGRYPDVIIELMSPTTASVDQVTKKELYEQTFHTTNYFIYDPIKADFFRGWHLDENNCYQELEVNEKGWLWCKSLNLWVGRWEGVLVNQRGTWLRFYHQDGSLVLLPEEAAKQRAEAEKQRAETEKQRAERLAARLRELGEDVDLI